jgi:DnaK suppressor protein
MDSQTIEILRHKLITRRDSVLHRRRRLLADEQELIENRESDWEDLAANQAAAARLDALAQSEALAIARIQASLQRIAEGTFGNCVVCHGAIETERLRAFPDVERCAGCTH